MAYCSIAFEHTIFVNNTAVDRRGYSLFQWYSDMFSYSFLMEYGTSTFVFVSYREKNA
jgi:hypothetical protein